IFGMPGLSGVGISFGADRIYDVLNTLDLYPKEAVAATQLLFINFGDKEIGYCIPIAAKCRQSGVSCEIYPDKAKMKKQMAYANAKGIRFVALAGENEIAQGKVTIKNMDTGEQNTVTPEEIISLTKL
ncbi:MAG: histidine--tRNA ligase, partial [Prevotella sp.]|nr:histidine--tRNA ligase [Prevotella sp.]